MPNRRSIAATALGALLLFPGGLAAQSPGGLAAQSIEISIPAFDVPVPSIGFDTSGVPDVSGFSFGEGGTAQHNESDFDFISRAVEEATSGISEALITTAAGIAEGLEEVAEALRDVGDGIASTMDDLAAIVVLCVDGGTCAPPDPPPPAPEP